MRERFAPSVTLAPSVDIGAPAALLAAQASTTARGNSHGLSEHISALAIIRTSGAVLSFARAQGAARRTHGTPCRPSRLVDESTAARQELSRRTRDELLRNSIRSRAPAA
jgi:hypothetical protein